MNSKTAAFLLFLICVVLGVGLFYRHSKAVHEKEEDSKVINQLIQETNVLTGQLDTEKKINVGLQQDLEAKTTEANNLSTRVAALSGDLDKSQADEKAAAEQLAAIKVEVQKKDAQIAKYEADLGDQAKRMAELNKSIADHDTQIKDYQTKLKQSDQDKTFLLSEIKRLQNEKDKLEKEFNDLAMLKSQVVKLKDELSAARQIEWIREGIYGKATQKGGEALLNAMKPAATASAASKTNYNLNVELDQKGGIKVTPITNSSAQNPVNPNR